MSEPTTPGPPPLDGWRVGVTADRRADQQADVLRRRGADVVMGCTMRTLDLTEDERLLDVSRSLVDRPPDTIVLQTGFGTTMWLEAMDVAGPGADLRRMLTGVEVLARGPKAANAARKAGLAVAWQSPREVSSDVAEHVADTGGRDRLALQLDGTDEELLAAPLAASCGEVITVPVYRWDLPADLGPAQRLVHAVCDGEVDAVTFTTKTSAIHLGRVAEDLGRLDELVAALDGERVVPVSVGPVCSSSMWAMGMQGLVEPERARLVPMIDALCARATGSTPDAG